MGMQGGVFDVTRVLLHSWLAVLRGVNAVITAGNMHAGPFNPPSMSLHAHALNF